MRQDDGTVQAAAVISGSLQEDSLTGFGDKLMVLPQEMWDPCEGLVWGTVSLLEGVRASERTKDAFVSTKQGNEGVSTVENRLCAAAFFRSSAAPQIFFQTS